MGLGSGVVGTVQAEGGHKVAGPHGHSCGRAEARARLHDAMVACPGTHAPCAGEHRAPATQLGRQTATNQCSTGDARAKQAPLTKYTSLKTCSPRCRSSSCSGRRGAGVCVHEAGGNQPSAAQGAKVLPPHACRPASKAQATPRVGRGPLPLQSRVRAHASVCVCLCVHAT